MAVEREKMFEIWNSDWHYEVGPDRDGMDMLEVRYYDGQETISKLRMSFSKEEAIEIAKSLLELAGVPAQGGSSVT